MPASRDLWPALEAASKTGFLVYPPLHPNESIEVRLLDDGSFLFTLFASVAAGPPPGVPILTTASARPGSASRTSDARRQQAAPVPLFRMSIGGSAGWGGIGRNSVHIHPRADLDEAVVHELMSAMTTNVMPGTPGQFGFLGAYNFITPEGWNTLCVGALNDPRPEGLPALNCFIESDWYPQSTEFRYAFKRGESLTWTHDTPIGQVIFVPRESVSLVEVSQDDVARLQVEPA